jgi:hypothetical protein
VRKLHSLLKYFGLPYHVMIVDFSDRAQKDLSLI